MIFGSKVTSTTSFITLATCTHEKSKEYLTSTIVALEWVLEESVKDLNSENRREKYASDVEGRRDILKRIIDVILFS